MTRITIQVGDSAEVMTVEAAAYQVLCDVSRLPSYITPTSARAMARALQWAAEECDRNAGLRAT